MLSFVGNRPGKVLFHTFGVCLLVMATFTSSAAAKGAAPRHYEAKTAPGVGVDKLNTITFTPEKQADSLLILIHGLGDTANGWADVGQMYFQRLKTTKIVLPTAPKQPVTMNGGMVMTSWYDIVGLTDRASETCEGIEESKKIIEHIMDEEHRVNGIPYNKMVCAGFSQGGAMSLFTGLQLSDGSKRLAGIVVMSGYLASASKFSITPGLETTPIFHGHGTHDPLVRFEWAEATRKQVMDAGATSYKFVPYRGLVHSVHPDEISAALQFITESFQASSTNAAGATTKTKEPKNYEELNINELKSAIESAGLGKQAVGILEKQDLIDLLKKNDNKDEL